MTTQEIKSDDVCNAAYQRLLKYAGKRRNEVRNPNITANEAIYIADRIKALEEMRERVRMLAELGIEAARHGQSDDQELRAILGTVREVDDASS